MATRSVASGCFTCHYLKSMVICMQHLGLFSLLSFAEQPDKGKEEKNYSNA
jgi:hypothetical protein